MKVIFLKEEVKRNINFKVMVEASDKDMVEPCGAEIKNLAFEGCLWSLGFQCMTRNFLVSLYSKFNQFFRCIISSEIPLLNFFFIWM